MNRRYVQLLGLGVVVVLGAYGWYSLQKINADAIVPRDVSGSGDPYIYNTDYLNTSSPTATSSPLAVSDPTATTATTTPGTSGGPVTNQPGSSASPITTGGNPTTPTYPIDTVGNPFTSTSYSVSIVSPTTATESSKLTTGTSTVVTVKTSGQKEISTLKLFDSDQHIDTIKSTQSYFVLPVTTAGSHSIVVEALNDAGNVLASSPPSIITVTDNVSPTVSFRGNTQSVFTIKTGDAFTLEVDADDEDDYVQTVEFYANNLLIGRYQPSSNSQFSWFREICWYKWQNIPAGEYMITAKAYDQRGASTVTSTPLMITVESENKLPTVALRITSPTLPSAVHPTIYKGKSVSIAATVGDPDGTIAKVELFANNVLVSESTSLPYTFEWVATRSGNYQIVGRVTDNKGAQSYSSLIISAIDEPVTNEPSKPNQVPTIQWLTPNNNAHYTSGTSVIFTTVAQDSDGSIARVEYYDGQTLLGSATTAPYYFAWHKLSVGEHTLYAKAIDNRGGSSSPATVVVTVSDPVTNQSPRVTLSSPTDTQYIQAGGTMHLAASAIDVDGRIEGVVFRELTSNRNSIARLENGWRADWLNVPAGTYRIVAIAIDDKGAQTETAPVTVTVHEANRPPVVTLVTPTTAIHEGEPQRLSVVASDPDSGDRVTRVQYSVNGQRVGESDTSPFNYSWTPSSVGVHTITAEAFDSSGVSTVSAPRTIEVGASVPTTIKIVEPFNGFIITQKTHLTMKVETTGSVWRVEYRQKKIGRFADYLIQATTTYPFNGVWGYVPNWVKTWEIYAVAFDRSNTQTESSPIRVNVSDSFHNYPPSVTMTFPTSTITKQPGSTLHLSADAIDFDWGVTRVEFVNTQNGQIIGTVHSPTSEHSYQYIWNNIPTGRYPINARAYDDRGGIMNTAAVWVFIE